jgi:hypothetical protein
MDKLCRTCKNRSIEILHEIYKNTLAYELESISVNEDGITTHLHSDRFLDEHPERMSSPEFTEDEEKKQAEFFGEFVKKLLLKQ